MPFYITSRRRSSSTTMSLYTALLVCTCMLSSTVVLLVGAARPVKTLCTQPIVDQIQTATHAAHTIQYYAAQFPLIEWRHRYLTSNDNGARNFVKSWVLNGTHCDFLVGPGYSYLAVAISTVVETLWVDPSATSTELSDKEAFPTFSRVIPTDEIGAREAITVYEKMGWDRTNIFCSDEPYGRSAALGISIAIGRLGGTIEVSRCLEASASGERVREVLEEFLRAHTRVVFVAMLPFHPLFQSFKREARLLNAQEQLIFFYSEAMCSGDDKSYTELQGGICLTYLANPAVIDPFLASYRSRNVAEDARQLQRLGFPSTLDVVNASNIYAVLAHDATFHAMSAIHEHYRTGSNESIITYLRSHRTIGATGPIALNSRGDREVVDGVVYNNIQENAAETVIGTTRNNTFVWRVDDPSANASQRPPLMLLGQLRLPDEPIPSAERPIFFTAERKSIINQSIGFGIAGGTVVIFIAAIVIRSRRMKDDKYAPKNQQFPFAIVFLDVENSTHLWAREPETMSDAIEKYANCVRKLLGKFEGYEVKNHGDMIMCAFQDAQNAVSFATQLQIALHTENWDDNGTIDRCYQQIDLDELGAGESPPQSAAYRYDEVWHGLRVRVGIHWGTGNIKVDNVTERYDYYGDVVNTAARVEAVANGGQVICTEAVNTACVNPNPSEVS